MTNETSDDMTVIDGITLKAVATVKLGKRPRGIQVSPDGMTLFVALSGTPLATPGKEDSEPPADKTADGIGVVNAATLKLERVIRGVSDPEQLAVSPDGKLLYIASEDTDFAVVLDVASGRKVASVKVDHDPHGYRYDPARQRGQAKGLIRYCGWSLAIHHDWTRPHPSRNRYADKQSRPQRDRRTTAVGFCFKS